jgi:NAD(P)-dependent dehydrogenase (short-subunit alcohol dehydrogenase family)
MDNLRLVVNNVGVLKLNGDLEMKPEDLQAQIIVNMYPITLMSKYAKLAFMKQS